VLAFLGMSDVEVIEVEGTAFGPEAAERAVTAALARVDAVALERRAA
jgi:FMN-dependent NADH-azoreductase